MKISLTTTPGLVKSINEDVVGRNRNVVCICDGHWGDQAAKLACQTILAKFPNSKSQAINLLETIQKVLFDLQTSDKPPETSVLGVKIKNKKITFLSYGDCRMLIVRNDKIIFSSEIKPTWLGALSYNQARNRLSARDGLIFGNFQLRSGDKVFMFTDGVDECVYEKPTIPHSWIIKHDEEEIFAEVQKHGAEDNASLVILKC